jgi:hypothetical protein
MISGSSATGPNRTSTLAAWWLASLSLRAPTNGLIAGSPIFTNASAMALNAFSSLEPV